MAQRSSPSAGASLELGFRRCPNAAGGSARALIVAPPRTGKTVLMQNIAHSITANQR
ncbi:hypothetical protein [Bradyrhizobium australafricanum]|uniref:hypothetical protein n=1 Tax=Bradyrhizobium australafricanum TaxID=2821406 RepID=UPI001CE3B4F9|nr:hypothetical protein [Bradyrhizobium australafricanum]MCA6104506.1 hypothetical protein [Bradyrhizobium australafricanum]